MTLNRGSEQDHYEYRVYYEQADRAGYSAILFSEEDAEMIADQFRRIPGTTGVAVQNRHVLVEYLPWTWSK